MATNRQYEATQIFNARIVDMRHLWEPSREYQGKPSAKPNYFSMFIIPKTQAHWSTEPAFGATMGAFGKLLAGQLQGFAQNPNMVQWPIIDGDMPNPTTGKTSEFAKGHWLFSGSTNSPPNVEMLQAGAPAPIKLANKIGVKSGDFVMVGVTAAVKTNQPNGVKFYLNAVVFTGPGEEIVFANSVSGAELMKMAEAQGLRPAGFSAAPGGFNAPQGGFTPPMQGGAFQPQGAGGFAPPAQSGGFTPPGFTAPAQGPTTFAQPQTHTPGGFAPPQGNGAPAYPSNNGAPSFVPPGGQR